MVIIGYMINRRHFPWLNIRHTVINMVSFDSLIHLDGKKAHSQDLVSLLFKKFWTVVAFG